jgi:hypothetical protein
MRGKSLPTMQHTIAKFAALSLIINTAGCLPPSSNVVVARVSSSENTAILSKRNSGAMSKGSTLVSVRANTVPDDSTHGAIVLGLIGDRPIEMKWTSPKNLALSCQTCSPQDVDFEVVKAGDITISYSDNLRVR